ncbi:MAG: hypothetical protein EOP87_15850 [Verrucomicrobiaceae bacterium]|nr:MAG: hypothetical protein EOP87_15850 [Verrucomicrobiaceae bacterium]
MKILLGATIALLLGAVGLSWHGMREGTKEASSDEVARLKKQVEELRLEQDRLQLEKQIQQVRASEPVAPQVSASERDLLKAELAAKDAEIARIAEEKAKAERDAKVSQDEEGLLGQRDLEKSDGELRRARLIGEALLMGKVKEFAEDPQFGSFVTFEVVMPENVQTGATLAIRRKTGIIGQIKVSEITPEGAIGNLLPGFGSFKPQPGDELILPPQ